MEVSAPTQGKKNSRLSKMSDEHFAALLLTIQVAFFTCLVFTAVFLKTIVITGSTGESVIAASVITTVAMTAYTVVARRTVKTYLKNKATQTQND